MGWRQAKPQQDGAAEPGIGHNGPPKRPTLKRFTWSRLHSDLLSEPLWALVAKRAGVDIPLVEALIVRLETHANKATPRGFVGDFNVLALAALWRVDEDMLAGVFAVLETDEIGWIDQDHIVTFWPRNPDDDGEEGDKRREQNRLRQQRKRERDKATRAALRAKASTLQPLNPSRVTQRDSVTVTPRADQIIKPSERDALSVIGAAHVYLHGEAEQLVSARARLMRSQACKQLERWSAKCGDLLALVGFLKAAAATDATEQHFITVVDEQIDRHRRGEQPALPLPPVTVRSATNG